MRGWKEVLAGTPPPIHLTPSTDDRALARRWLDEFQGGGIDGVVAKRRDLEYTPGRRAMLKVKHDRTIDCVVGGARGSGDPLEIWSLLLGLYARTASSNISGSRARSVAPGSASSPRS